jgi:hypothetical protein
MTTFYGTPYVDVRIDFNSWIPSDLNEKISQKIIKYYLKKFNDNDDIHDKIEFEILFTCATFTTKKRLENEFKNILNKKEIQSFYKSLKKINLISFSKRKDDSELIKILEKKQSDLKISKLYEIDKIYWAIEDCKKYGTLPFAGLARCGFVGVELLNSLQKIGAISENEKINFLSNIKTITTEMKNDLLKLNKKDFLIKYGHLRPGTYDITSKNYKSNYKEYFNHKNSHHKKTNYNKKKKFTINKKTRQAFKKLGIYKNINDLFDFIKKAIAQREYSKFIFQKV